jgi:CRISPR-associated endonuclease/helicase Cas3
LHAALGGSAILLSATLTAHLKRRLAGAFAHGAGWRAPDDGPLATEAYPAVTVADAAGPRAHPVAAPAGAHRRIPVTVTDDPTAVRDHLLAVARAGGCALWMRNTVDDAIAAYDTLAGEHADVILLHARFPAARRAELEDGIMRRFGPDSRGADRAGAIVVATQVLEQSLDLDFDAMVADLKPIDALLQSAGRMRRHARDANGDPAGAHAGDARGDGALWVFGPRFAAAPEVDWYKGVLPRAAYVYPRIGWLWRTAELLETRGELRQPDDLRGLIEHALPDDDPDLPDGILAAADDALAQAMAERSHAGDKLLQPDLGYTRADGQWPDDERMPTRLGESVELCLVAVGDAGEFLPWGPDGYADGFARVRANLIKGVRDSLEADPRADGLKATLPALRWRVIVPLVVDPESGTWSYTPTGGDAATITYDAMRGIRSCNSGGA